MLFQEAMKLAQPVLVGYILSYLQDSGTISLAEAYLCAAGMVLISLFFSLPYTLCINISWGIGMRGRASLTGLVYNKVYNQNWLNPSVGPVPVQLFHTSQKNVFTYQEQYAGYKLNSLPTLLQPATVTASVTVFFVDTVNSWPCSWLRFLQGAQIESTVSAGMYHRTYHHLPRYWCRNHIPG